MIQRISFFGLPLSLALTWLGCGVALAQEAVPTDPLTAELVQVNRIWDQGKHNAFTDLVRHRGNWFCVFREGSAHVSPDGSLRVLKSTDGVQWSSVALLKHKTGDLRDAKIVVTPDGRLMLSGAVAMPKGAGYRHQSLVWFSDDGSTWSDAVEVADRDFWLWRTTWHDGKAYGIAYATGGQPKSTRLYASDDGQKFQTLVENLFDEGYPNETSMLFDSAGESLCLLRRDGGTKTGQLGFSSPPYKQWEWKDLGTRIGGPHLIRIPGGELIAVVRLYDGGARTSVCRLDADTAKLTELLKLPSGGDTSYAGMVWHEGHLCISYYSAHEHLANGAKSIPASTSIYFAKVKIDRAEAKPKASQE